MTVTVTGGITFSGGLTFAPGASGGPTQKAIFGYGQSVSYTAVTNLVSNTGVVATDTTGVGTVRQDLAAAGYSTS